MLPSVLPAVVLALAASHSTPVATAAAADGAGAGRGSSAHPGRTAGTDDALAMVNVVAFEAGVLPRAWRDEWFDSRFSPFNEDEGAGDVDSDVGSVEDFGSAKMEDPVAGGSKSSGSCGDPMVKEMVEYDNEARATAGVAPLRCDSLVSGLAYESSKGQCKCGPALWATLQHMTIQVLYIMICTIHVGMCVFVCDRG